VLTLLALAWFAQDTLKGDGEKKDRNNNLNKNNQHNLCIISPLQLPASQSISLTKQKRAKRMQKKKWVEIERRDKRT
jgi:hypothetical protein